MFRYNDRIAVGVSGGKDSVTLLHRLAVISKQFPRSELVVVIIDEGIEGYREEGLRLATMHAKSLDLEYNVSSFESLFDYGLDDLLSKLGERHTERTLAACGYCGIMRRQALNSAAMNVDADVLATGHNLDDEAQTVLMNMMRGDLRRLGRFSGLRRKVHKGLVPRVKPLRLTPEPEIVLNCIFNDLEYQETPCPHSVEANRGPVRRFMTEYLAEQPSASLNLLYSADRLVEMLGERMLETDNAPSETREGSSGSRFAAEQEFTTVCERCGQPTANPVCKMCEIKDELSKRINSKRPRE